MKDENGGPWLFPSLSVSPFFVKNAVRILTLDSNLSDRHFPQKKEYIRAEARAGVHRLGQFP